VSKSSGGDEYKTAARTVNATTKNFKIFWAMPSFAIHFINTGFQAGATRRDTSAAVLTAYSCVRSNEAVETALTLLLLGTGLKAGANHTSDRAKLNWMGFAIVFGSHAIVELKSSDGPSSI
jgi:hypothetical protein